MNTNFTENFKNKILDTKEKELAYENLQNIENFITGSSRIEKIYLSLDKIVAISQIIYPKSHCISCSLECCINDLFLPISFFEWKSIETYLNTKVEPKIKAQIKENLENLPQNLFVNILDAKDSLFRYKKACPLLIDNKCSIYPYRPIPCRTYGWFVKNKNNFPIQDKYNDIEIKKYLKNCSLEINRWKNDIIKLNEKKIYLFSMEKVEEALYRLNFKKTGDLLIVWLKNYFYI